MQYSYFMLALL